MTLRRYSGVAMTSIRSSSGIGHEVVLDEVRARPEHRVAVGLQGAVEVGRVVGLDPVDDLGLAGVRVDLAGRRDAGRLLLGQLLPAELEDVVGIEAVEGPRATSASWRSRPIGQSSVPSASVPSSQVPYSSTATLAASTARSSRRRSAGARTPSAGGHDLVEERRQLGRRSRSRCPARAGPAGPVARVRDRLEVGRARPRGGRRSPRAARRAARGRGRTAGTGRRRSRRGPSERRSQMRRTSVSKMAAADVVELEVALEPGGRATAPAGSSASTAARCARSASSSARTASRPPSPSSSSCVVEARGTCRGPGCRDEPPEARLDEVVEARRRADPRSGGRRGSRQAGTVVVVVRASGSWCGRRCAAGRRGGGRSRVRRWRRPVAGAAGAASVSASAVARRVDDRVDVVGRHVVVGDGADLTVRIFHHQDVPRSERGEERARGRARPGRATKLVATRPGSRRSAASGWAMPPGARMPSSPARRLGQPPGVGVVLGQAVDHPVRAVLQRDQTGRREDPDLAHPATDAACARAARGQMTSRRADDDRADRAAEALATGRTSRCRPARRGRARSRRPRAGRRPRSRTGRRRCGAGRRARARSPRPPGCRPGVSGWPIEWACVFSSAMRPVIGSWRSIGSRNAASIVGEVQRAVGAVVEGADARADDDRVAGRLVDDDVVLAAGDRLLAAPRGGPAGRRGCPSCRWRRTGRPPCRAARRRVPRGR